MQKNIWEAIGWIGAVIALSAFSLNSFNLIGSQSPMYLGMYSTGCILMAAYGFVKNAPASWVLNLIFLLVALIALIRSSIL